MNIVNNTTYTISQAERIQYNRLHMILCFINFSRHRIIFDAACGLISLIQKQSDCNDLVIFTDCISEAGNAIGSVLPSIPLVTFNTDLFSCAGHDHSSRGTVKVKGQNAGGATSSEGNLCYK